MKRYEPYALVAVLAAIVVFPRTAAAMELQMFDDMAAQDQQAYVKFLVASTQRVLIQDGHEDVAKKIQQLFHGKVPGDRRSPGEVAFEQFLVETRADVAAKTYPLLHFDVESVLFMTFGKNEIVIPSQSLKNLAQRLREKPFWPKFPLRAAATATSGA